MPRPLLLRLIKSVNAMKKPIIIVPIVSFRPTITTSNAIISIKINNTIHLINHLPFHGSGIFLIK